jgi:hypothetical protein
MKPRLIIISDLWGIENSKWVNKYIKILASKFEIQFYDSCELGQIDKSEYEESNLHNQFINGGIEIAVKMLLKLEHKEIDILAFSIGGVIAWKAQLNGLKINNFYAISSTRLRNEQKKPKCRINLYFGEKDIYKPTSNWFDSFGLKPKIFKNKDHKLYTENDCINEICNDIKTSCNNL